VPARDLVGSDSGTDPLRVMHSWRLVAVRRRSTGFAGHHRHRERPRERPVLVRSLALTRAPAPDVNDVVQGLGTTEVSSERILKG